MKDAYSIREYGLAHLTDHESLHDVLQAFGELVQTGIALHDDEGNPVGELRVTGPTPCDAARRSSPDRMPCGEVMARALDAGDGPEFATCPMGLVYVSSAFVVEGERLGRVVLGPFVPVDAPPSPMLAVEILGNAEAAAAIANVRKLSRERAAAYLASLVKVLSAVVYSAFRVGVTSQVHLESIRGAYVELELANRRLEKALHAANEANRLKTAFLATVSHELKTPLTSILGYSEMLMDGTAGPLSASQGEYARTIFEKGEALQRLISGVLELTRLESGTVTTMLKAGRLDAVAAPVISSHRVTAAAKGLDLKFDFPADLPEFVFDHEKLRVILHCLVDNAVKFTPPGGRVTVTAEVVGRRPAGDGGRFGSEEAEHVAIAVADTGPGIPPEMTARIFDSFYQIDSSDTREHGGMGIGLRLVKGYVELHRGQIEVASESGKGARFTVYIPRRVHDARVDGEAAVPAMRM